MVNCEGKGMVPPKQIPICVTPAIMSAAFDAAKSIGGFRKNWQQGKTWWERGLIDSMEAPLVGKLQKHETGAYIGIGGEMLFAELVNARLRKRVFIPNTAKLKRGDGGADFRVHEIPFQVKTRRRQLDQTLIRRVDERKRLVLVHDGALVVMWWDGGWDAAFVGWQWVRHIKRNADLCKARKGIHFNLSLDDKHLLPLGDLVAEIESCV
jgi:hypothetical protein